MKNVKAFFMNTLLLTATALLMRTIGVAFNAYLSQKIGEAGIGLFQLIMSVYTLAVTFASSGIRLAATRLTVEELSRPKGGSPRHVIRCCLGYSLLFGCAAAIALFFGAEWISVHWLGERRPILSLKLLAVSLPFLAMSAALSGYFTAVRKIVKLSSSQLFEQFIRITATVMLLTILLPKGLEYACVAIVIGSCLAEVGSFFFVFLLYWAETRHRHDAGASPKAVRRLLKIALPDAVSSYVRSGLLTLEHLLIPVGFRKSGASSEGALAAYGKVHGMVLPIVLYPAALLNSLSSMLVPEMAECYEKKNTVRINYIITRVLQMTLLFSIGTAGIFYCFSGEVGRAVYGSSDTSRFIQLLAPLVPVMYLDTAVDGMLKGLGEQVSSMRYNIIDSLLSVILVYTLLPRFAVKGYIVMLFATEILNFTLSINRLNTISNFRIRLFGGIIAPVFCIAGSVSVTQLFFRFTGLEAAPGLQLALSVLLTTLVYLLSLRLSCCITKSDIRWFRSIFQK